MKNLIFLQDDLAVQFHLVHWNMVLASYLAVFCVDIMLVPVEGSFIRIVQSVMVISSVIQN